MGDRSMTECLVEQLVTLNASLPNDGKLDGSRAMRWYDDGADISLFLWVGANVNGLRAWGYLEGVADVFDVTVGELLEAHHLDWSGSETFSRAKLARCPKPGCKSTNIAKHRGTSQCLACETAWNTETGVVRG